MMYEVVTDLKELVIDTTKPVFVDTETGGSKTITKEIQGKVITRVEEYAYVVTVQVFQEHWDKVKVFIISELPSYALEFIWGEISKTEMVGHNYGYDIRQFKKHCDIDVTNLNWQDTFYLSRLRYPSWQKYSLDKCLTNVLGYDPYAKEGLVKKDMQKSFSPDTYPTPAQLTYASVDVFLLPKLYNAVTHYIDSAVYKLDKHATIHGIDMWLNGMPVDLDRLEAMRVDFNKQLEEVTAKLPAGLNVNSYMQVRKAIHTAISSDSISMGILINRPAGLKDFWLRLKPNSAGKFPAAAHTALAEGRITVAISSFGKRKRISTLDGVSKSQLVYYNEILAHSTDEDKATARNIILKRKLLKRLNFVERAKANMWEDGRLHAQFTPSAINGRVQQSDENLTQYPRNMKTMFGFSASENKVLVYADYSQLELRTICALLPERNMEKAYKDKLDIHQYTSDNMQLDEDKLPLGVGTRNVAKVCNFGLLYGGGAKNFQQMMAKSGMWFEMDFIEEAMQKWFDTFSDIKAWHVKNSHSEDNVDSTILGRRYKANIITDLNNIKVSGSGADVAKTSLHYIYNTIASEYNKVLNFVHDSFIVECDNDPDVYIPVAEKLGEAMRNGWYDVMKSAPIADLPMPVDVLVGKNWGDIEKGNVIYETIIGE